MTASGETVQAAARPHSGRPVITVLFIALVLAVGYAFFTMMQPFVGGLAWASVLAITLQPLFRRLRRRLKVGAASLATTAIAAVTLIAPAACLVIALAAECINAANRIASMDADTRIKTIQSVERFWAGLQQRFPALQGVDPIASLKANVVHISGGLAAAAGALAGNILSFMGLGLFILLALFFLLRDGPALVGYLRRLSPLDFDTTGRLFDEIRALTESSVTASLLIALVQGTLGGVTTGILGLPSPLIWGVAFGFCSFIPVVGAGLAWIPAVVWLLLTGHQGRALIMLLVSVIIIGQADNVIRPLLVSGRSRLNFELTVLSVLGGVTAFGMLGLILGPIVMVILTALMDVYLETKAPLSS